MASLQHCVITDLCINCGRCADFCPHDVISAGDPIHVIDIPLCTGCGTCQAVCPVPGCILLLPRVSRDLRDLRDPREVAAADHGAA